MFALHVILLDCGLCILIRQPVSIRNLIRYGGGLWTELYHRHKNKRMTLDEARTTMEGIGYTFVRMNKGCSGCGIGDSILMDVPDAPHLTLQIIKHKNLIGRFVIKNKTTNKPLLTGALDNILTILNGKDFSIFE